MHSHENNSQITVWKFDFFTNVLHILQANQYPPTTVSHRHLKAVEK